MVPGELTHITAYNHGECKQLLAQLGCTSKSEDGARVLPWSRLVELFLDAHSAWVYLSGWLARVMAGEYS